MEYDGFLASGAATLTPTVRFDTPNLSFGGQGSWTVFESGSQIFQTTAAVAWFGRRRERWRPELSGAAGVSRYADAPVSGHILARSRLHFRSERAGGWLGAATGASFDGSARTPVELTLGAWRVRERFAVVGTVTGTWLGGARHMDITAEAKWTFKRTELEVQLGARPVATSDSGVGEAVTGVWGEISAQVAVAPRVAFTFSGGSYPADPVRRALGAKYLTAGLQLAIAGADESPTLAIPAALRDLPRGDVATRARLEIVPVGRLHAVRVYVEGATAVELMGDFSDWLALPLEQVDGDTWEIQLNVSAGVHRLNIRIDGGPWLVPAGARPEPDDFGSIVGVINVSS